MLCNYAFPASNIIELLENNPEWHFNQDWYIFIQENAFENVWKIAAILPRPQCDKWHRWVRIRSDSIKPNQNKTQPLGKLKCDISWKIPEGIKEAQRKITFSEYI